MVASWCDRKFFIQLNERELLIATINKKLAVVRSLLSHCVAKGYLNYSVAANIGQVKQDKENKATNPNPIPNGSFHW
jgi:hypothetical protein